MKNGNETIVLIPSYNANYDLYRTIGSIGCDENVDVLIIDDGSITPPDIHELNRVFKANGTIYLDILSKNSGITFALNYGLKWIEEKGYKFVARLDAGDLNKPNRFCLQEKFLKANENIGLVGSWVNFVDEKGAELFTLKHPVNDGDIRKAIYRFNPFVHPAVMYRLDIIKTVGGYPNSYPALEDWACFLAMTKFTQMHNLPEVLVEYEVASNSISSQKRFIQSKSKVKLLYDNFSFNMNQIVGLVKNTVILILPRSALTKIKQWLKR